MYFDRDNLKRLLRLANSPSTASWRRVALINGLMPIFAAVHSFNGLTEAVDDRLFEGYRDQPVGEPIFIVAAPRSGTTFLHRLMSLDPQFTAFKLYETIFPTVTAHRIAELLAAMPVVPGVLQKLSDRFDERAFSGWDGVHKTSLTSEEEDEGLWFMAMASPALQMALPFPEELEPAWYVDNESIEKRRALVHMFRTTVQRHLYCNPGKVLLHKSVLLQGRYNVIREAVPDVRFVHLVRHPYEAVASSVSMFGMPWRWHSPEVPVDDARVRRFAEYFVDYYRILFEEARKSEAAQDGRFFELRYDELMQDPLGHVKTVYEKLELHMSPEAEAALKHDLSRQRSYRSKHDYSLAQFGVDPDMVYEPLKAVFEYYGFDRYPSD